MHSKEGGREKEYSFSTVLESLLLASFDIIQTKQAKYQWREIP